jgi:hypothetical protein
MALHIKRKVPNNLSQGNGIVTNQPSFEAPSSSHTKINPFYQENHSYVRRYPPNVQVISCAENLKQSVADWTGVFNDLKNAIKIRQYSPATLRLYSSWTRKFQAYTKSKDPQLLDVDEVKEFFASARNLATGDTQYVFYSSKGSNQIFSG